MKTGAFWIAQKTEPVRQIDPHKDSLTRLLSEKHLFSHDVALVTINNMQKGEISNLTAKLHLSIFDTSGSGVLRIISSLA